MAYSTSDRLDLKSAGPIGGAGGREWFHESADAAAAVDTSGFITNGGDRGLRVGDYVDHRDTGTNITTRHRVVSVSATAPGAVDLADGTTISSGTNTD